MKSIQLTYAAHILNATISLSGSKSISNRLLMIRALADGKKQFQNLSDSNDTKTLDFYLNRIKDCSLSSIPLVIDAGNAGTTFRFLLAMLSMTEGKWLLTGSERMKERPIESLFSALEQMGASLAYTTKDRYPPIRVVGEELSGGTIKVDASSSSQFVSALMLIGPLLKKGLTIDFGSEVVSYSYIEMTQKLMCECGADVKIENNKVEVQPGKYRLKPLSVEPDWSSASYFYELAALSENANILLPGFHPKSVQGDRVAASIFNALGVDTIFEENGMRLKSTKTSCSFFEYDFSSSPDLVPAVLACCAGKGIPALIKGVGHLKYKESDRLMSMKKELAKLGVDIHIGSNSAELIPSSEPLNKLNCVFDTYDDHRIAMALAPLVLVMGSLTINSPSVTSKSYPMFWNDLRKLGIETQEFY